MGSGFIGALVGVGELRGVPDRYKLGISTEPGRDTQEARRQSFNTDEGDGERKGEKAEGGRRKLDDSLLMWIVAVCAVGLLG
jgi:hypothetical protein